MQTAAEIRKAFLDFFQAKGHLLVPSSSLIPAGDPTLLLTSAGMVQFKPYFTGEMTPPQPKLTSVQKCFRVSDVDSVGDTSHLTFFEMLGNFSVGDYFKKEAITWGWEFVTQQMGLKPERLWATVFRDDDEAYALWQQTGIPARRIRRFDEKDNFWGPAGDEGPCGPCSEIHYDFGGTCRLGKPLAQCGPNCECGRFLELWNLVFMQFYQDKQGKRTPLPRPNIDTGMGLERAALILQGKASIYETDLFVPIIDRVCKLANKQYGQDPETDKAIRVVAEHARSAAFLIADGVVPGPNKRAAVLRKVIHRAILFGRKLELGDRPSTSSEPALSSPKGRTEEDFSVRGEPVEPRAVLPQVAEVVIDHMDSFYPELASGREFILRVLQLEEEGFSRAFDTAYGVLTHTFLEVRTEIKNYLPTFKEQVEAALSVPDGIDVPLRIRGAVDHYFRDGFGDHVFITRGRDVLAEVLSPVAKALERLRDEATNKSVMDFVSQPARDPFSAFTAYLQAFAAKVEAEVNRLFASLSGVVLFALYDTYGFPVEVTAEIARGHGLSVDMEGFQKEMEEQQKLSRAAGGFGTGLDAVRIYQELGVAGTRFLGYDATSAPSVVVALLVNGVSADRADEGQQVEVVLRETPFYAEGGGQAGDTGFIEAPGWYLQVEDTQSPIAGLIVHKGKVVRGTAQLGEMVTATVDRERRLDCARNHTATHLLHAALRQVLGAHVRQQGSLVAPDRLRFDFTHVSPLTREELRQVESLVNDRIRANVPVHKRETTYRQAVAEGALAFFGERYGDRVRVVEVPGSHAHEESVIPSTEPVLSQSKDSGRTEETKPFSFEVCGGTHIDDTGEIGYCHVLGESSVGAGLRRIEAVTGRAAEESIRHRLDLLGRAEFFLKAADDNFMDKLTSLAEEHVAFRNQLRKYERGTLREQAQELLERVHVQISGIEIVTGTLQVDSADALREVGDWLRDKLGSGVVVLGAVVKERPTLLVMVTPDLVTRGLHAGNVVKEAAKVMGGGGGGRPEMAQAGGRQADKLADALRVAIAMVAQQASGS